MMLPGQLVSSEYIDSHIKSRTSAKSLISCLCLSTIYSDDSRVFANDGIQIVGSLTKPRNCKKTNFSGEAKN